MVENAADVAKFADYASDSGAAPAAKAAPAAEKVSGPARAVTERCVRHLFQPRSHSPLA